MDGIGGTLARLDVYLDFLGLKGKLDLFTSMGEIKDIELAENQ